MKKMLYALMAAFMFILATHSATAQVPKDPFVDKIVSRDTTSNTDTSIVYLNPSNSSTATTKSKVTSFQASVLRVSGTVGGYVLLQYTNDFLAWKDVNTDTLTITSLTSGYQSKIWTNTAGTSAAAYRLWYKSTGTQTSTLTGSVCRRPDERND